MLLLDQCPHCGQSRRHWARPGRSLITCDACQQEVLVPTTCNEWLYYVALEQKCADNLPRLVLPPSEEATHESQSFSSAIAITEAMHLPQA